MTNRIHQEKVTTLWTIINALDCPQCGVVFGITADYEKNRRSDGKVFVCPNGHSMGYGETAIDRERKRAEEAERRLRAEKEWSQRQVEALGRERRSHSATKGQLTKAKNRAAAGQCLKCRRHFMNVERHYETQHGDGENEWQLDGVT